MSDILKGLRTYLVSKSKVTGVASNRVYFHNLPQRPTFPAAVLHMITSESQSNLADSDGLVRTQIQIDCVSDNHDEAENLSEQIRQVTVKHTPRTWGTESVRSAYVTDRRDLTQPPVDGSQLFHHVRALDLVAWHTETLPST